MSTGAQPSSINDLATFTIRLDGLRANQNPDDLSNALRAAFKERELYNMYISSLIRDPERARVLLEVFDKVLQVTTCDVATFKRARRLCGLTGLLPTSHTIPGEFIEMAEHPIAFGAFGDVWEGTYNDNRVAIKTLRLYKRSDLRKVRKRFCKEVLIWNQISHPSIVPFLGVSEVPAPLSMVSEWMPNGNVREYVRKNPETSRLQLLLEISRGLAFLHSFEIVHGDLKGDNILIDKSGRARLADFGFTTIAGLNCSETSASRFRGSYRWMAPELFNVGAEGKSGLSTRESDVFALGMVTFEVFTGQLPFSECNASPQVMIRIMDGKRPSRPPKGEDLGLSDELWGIIQSLLAHEAVGRPSVSLLVDVLEKATLKTFMLEELAEFDVNSEEHIQKLRRVLECGDNTFLEVQENETLVLIEVFDRILNSSLDDPTLCNQCLHGLQKIAARCGLLPKSYWISHTSLAEPNDAPLAAGRISSTRRWLVDGNLVAIKTITPDCVDNFDAFKHRLCTNAIMWRRLRHPNVVSFIGFGSDYLPFSIIYHWMPNGSLSEYLREHPDVDKLSLLSDVAHGLTYLHRCDLVHGNLTGDNILVDGDGVACISEYGLEIVLRDGASLKSIPTSLRRIAPEVPGTSSRRIQSEDDGRTADVYSFTMIVFEVLSGTVPFPPKSDEETVDKVTSGSRPEWPSNNPLQKLVDELWEQIVAYWNQEPNGRPTVFKVLQTLRVLGEAQHEEPMISVEDSDDEVTMGDWDYIEDDPKEMLTCEEREGYYNSGSRSSSTLTLSSSVPDPTLPHRSESGIRGSDGPNRRFGTKIEKYMRNLFHLQKRAPETITTKAVGRRKIAAKKSTSGTEIVIQREEEVIVCNSCLPYIASQPIPEGKTLRKVVITVVSKDQGWSNYLEDYGTYRNSWTWFELSVGSPSKDSGKRWRDVVVTNIHADSDFKEHSIEIYDGELYEKAQSGDVLTVWALAKFSGWTNTVKKATIRYVVE